LPATPEAISAAVGEVDPETLDELDREFLEYPHDLTELLFAFVSERSKAFGTLPDPD
jgi:hypothetical protein